MKTKEEVTNEINKILKDNGYKLMALTLIVNSTISQEIKIVETNESQNTKTN